MAKKPPKGMKADLIAAATGKHAEPTWNLLTPPSKVEMISALNFYNVNYDSKKKREWALKIIKEKHPKVLKRAEKAPLFMFGTCAVMLRMVARGIILADHHRVQLDNWLDELGPIQTYDEEETPKVKPKRKSKSVANMQSFDDHIDLALRGDTAIPEIDAGASVSEVIAYCTEQLKIIKEDSSQYPKHMKKWFQSVLDKVTAVNAVTKTRVITKRKPRKKDPLKIVKSVKYLLHDSKLKIDSLKPTEVLGKKKLYLYDVKLRKLKRIVATGEGFTFKGTTLMNVDLSKSFIKTIRKPEDVVAGKTKTGIRELDRSYNLVKGKELPITTAVRLNDNTVFIGAS